MPDTETIKPNICVVKIDDTEYWADDIVKRAGRILSVYVYDANRHVHCCEATPSYELNFVESQPLEVPEDDDEREALLDDIDEGDSMGEQVHYYHVRSIDKIEETEHSKSTSKVCRFSVNHLFDEYDDSDEAIEAALEWAHANAV